ncbi:hypothetical protein ABZP36_002294 [Zizania latifolia]
MGGGGGEAALPQRRRCLVEPGFIATAGAGDVRLPAKVCFSSKPKKFTYISKHQGSPGTVTEETVLKYFPDCIAVSCKKFGGAFEAVNSSLADIVVLPIENSSTGSFHQNYDLLLGHKLHVVQEVQVDIELCLLALPGVHKIDLRTVFSHPEELAQCEHSVSSLDVVKKNVDHCAAGAEIISMQNLGDAGVIGSAQASGLHGLNIIECNFQDASPKLTRYFVLAKIAGIPEQHGQHKTSIAFCLEEGPGMLFKALGAFWKRDISLTKIESIPNKRKPMRTQGTGKQFNYIFFVDFEASTAETHVQNALKDIKQIATLLRVLGCYPVRATV